MRKLAFQSPHVLTVPLSQLSPNSLRTLESILKRAHTTEVEGADRKTASFFAHCSRSDMAMLERHNVHAYELALIEEVSRLLFSAMLPQRPEAAPGQILAHCLLDELDWRFPSRYAASKALQRLAAEKGLASSLSESDLSKLENTGKGVSAERISETIYLLGSAFSIRQYFGPARLCEISSFNYSESSASSWLIQKPLHFLRRITQKIHDFLGSCQELSL
jgi:hypothetical protein